MFDEVQQKPDFYTKLVYMYEHLTEDNMQECVDLLQTLEFKTFVVYIKNKKLSDGYFTSSDYSKLSLFIAILQTIYNYSGFDTGITDSDYDILNEVLEDANLDFVSSAIRSRNEVTHHKYTRLRGTLSKIYVLDNEDVANKSRMSLETWVKRKTKYLQDTIHYSPNLMNEVVYVFPKWNGISIIHEFDENNELIRSLTRGYTELNEAEDVTAVFKPIEERVRLDEEKAPAIKGRAYGLKTEVIIRNSDFERFEKENHMGFKSARSLCNAIILGDKVGEHRELLNIRKLRYSFFNDVGIETLEENCPEAFNDYLVCELRHTEAIRKFAENSKTTNGFDCDGVVIQFQNEDLKENLGRDGSINRFEVAYKFNEEVSYTKLTGIIFQTGPLGRITPIAEFEPVVMKGNTISKASLGSYQRMMSLHLHIGDTVKILYEIVPYLVFDENDPKCKHTKKKLIEFPTFCPECGEKFEEFDAETDSPKCSNPDCPSRVKGKILNYVRKMKIEMIDYETISTLFDAGFLTSIKDLYKLEKKRDVLVLLPGFGPRKVDGILNEINFRRHVRGSDLLGSLGINGASKKVFRSVLMMFTMEEILEFAEKSDMEPFLCIRGIKEKKAVSIISGINENRSLIRFLLKELSIEPEDVRVARFLACFHNIRSNEVTKLIESKGGKVCDSLTKAVDFLIVPENNGETSKVVKAKKYGIPIVTINEAINYINENYR